MKIEEKKIESYKVLLSKGKLFEVANCTTATLFFPIDVPERQQINSPEASDIILLEKTEKTGASKFVKPGLIVQKIDDNYEILLAYVSTEYLIPFSLAEYFSLASPKVKAAKLKRKEEEVLLNLDCFIVRSNQVVITFK